VTRFPSGQDLGTVRGMNLLRKIILSLGLLLALVPACGPPPTPPEGIDVSPELLTATHTVGTTPCPQEVGVITIRNDGDEEIRATPVGAGANFELRGPDGVALGDSGTVTVPAGESRTVTVVFLCTTEPPLTTLLDFQFTRGGADAGTASVSVDLARGP
jgi:hypothetical protein